MVKISVPQHKQTLDGDTRETLMEVLLKNQIPVASSCKGDGICGKCKMYIRSSEHLPAPGPLEERTLENAKAESGERLSCQILCKLPLEVRTSYW